MSKLGYPFLLVMISIAVALGGCSQGNSGDQQSVAGAVPQGLDRFLLFPNPVVAPGGSFETNTTAYASAYYRAIDPASQKDTLAKWKAANGFGGGGNELLAVFRDVLDLGYGRRMTGRRNMDGSVAFFVENYNVSNVPGGYSTVNVDAAVARDTKWHVGTNAIEWSVTPCDAALDPGTCDPTVKFAKYFNFSSVDGTRQLTVDLDGRGQKAMPGPCITCHGGRGDPLTPPDAGTGLPRFALVGNSVSQKRGDTEGKLQPFRVDTFEWSTAAGFTRADQEATLKAFNQWVLCTYPGGGNVTGTWGNCTRPAAGPHEWQGTAAEMLEAFYGGPGMPNAQFSDTYLPAGWASNANLYQQVLVPFCRTCHLVRGTADESDIDFATLAKFQGYADRIKVHVFDRGNMPLARLVYTDFWTSTAPATLASFVDSVLGAGTATSAGGAPLQPGRPIADPGPNRMVRAGVSAPLSGADSLFASSFSWAVTASPGGGDAVIGNPGTKTTTFQASMLGDYTVRLTASNGSQSDSKNVVITVNASFPDPATIKFAHVQDVLRNVVHSGAQQCVDCHFVGGDPPIAYTNVDRDGVGGVTATDEAWLLQELRGRVNLTEVSASALLRKPSGHHHAGGTLFDLATVLGQTSFSKVYYWIVNGLPPGGVVANAGADSSPSLSFSGVPPTASIPLDGSQSINATTYLWSIVTQPDALNFPASISNTTTAAPTLTIRLPGTYVVQLQVTDGVGGSDTAQRTITVTEPAAVANANSTNSPQNTNVTFGGNPLVGTITLDGSSSQNALTYQWSVQSGPGGAVLSNATSAVATLTVPASAIGLTYVVQLQVANVSTNDTDTRTITVVDNTAGVTAGFTYDGLTTGPVAKTFTGGTPAATIALNSSSSTTPANTTLTRTWSVFSSPNISAVSPGVVVASLSSTSAVSPTLTVRATGSYTIRLVVTNGLSTDQLDRTFTVNPAQGFSFASLRSAFGSIGCTGCHSYANGATNPDPAANSNNAPSWANENDSNGKTLYQRVRDRVNLGTPTSSLLVLNPSNDSTAPNTNGHGGGCQPSFGCAADGSTNYNNFLHWIQDGAPPAQ